MQDKFNIHNTWKRKTLCIADNNIAVKKKKKTLCKEKKKKAEKKKKKKLFDKTIYKSTIGSLIYLSKKDNSDILFAVNKASSNKVSNQQFQTGKR